MSPNSLQNYRVGITERGDAGPDLIKDKFCWVDIMVNRPGFRHDVPLAPPSVLRTGAHAMLYGIDKQGKYTWFTVHHLAHQSLADWVKNLQYS